MPFFFIGGELQRTAIVLCLGKAADLYILDEPSAYLGGLFAVAISFCTQTSAEQTIST